MYLLGTQNGSLFTDDAVSIHAQVARKSGALPRRNKAVSCTMHTFSQNVNQALLLG